MYFILSLFACLVGTVVSVCRVMGRQALSQERLGAAIWWGVRSKDAAFTSHLAHQVGLVLSQFLHCIFSYITLAIYCFIFSPFHFLFLTYCTFLITPKAYLLLLKSLQLVLWRELFLVHVGSKNDQKISFAFILQILHKYISDGHFESSTLLDNLGPAMLLSDTLTFLGG